MRSLCCLLALASALSMGTASAAMQAQPDSKTKPAALPAKPAPKKVEPIGHVDGLEIARPNGTFLGLQIVSSNFVLSFYDADRKKMAPDVVRATLRWPVKYQPGDERTVLNAGSDGTSLSSGKTVRPPHNFKVFIGLFVEGNDSPIESYSVDYRPDADAGA